MDKFMLACCTRGIIKTQERDEMSEPTKPGWWWAKAKHGGWEVVEVRQTGAWFEVWTVKDLTAALLSDFTFGPEVTKPEELDHSVDG